MPANQTNPAVQAAYGELVDLQLESRKRVLRTLTQLDPSLPETLAYAARALLQTHFEPAVLAGVVGTSRTTIGRWAKNQTISRSQPYRSFAVDKLKNHLAEVVANSTVIGEVAKTRRASTSSVRRKAMPNARAG